MSFRSRKDEGSRGGRFRAKVTREEAIRIARTKTPEGWELYSIEARMARAWRERPLGYPVWDVKVKYRQPIQMEKPLEGVEPVREPRYVLMANSYVIDAITGEVAPPPVPTSLRPKPPGSSGSPRITREEAIRLAAESVEKALQESSQEGWARTKVFSAELDTSGTWRAPGHPVWDVRLQYEKPGEGEAREGRLHRRLVDGVSGEVIAYP